MFGKTLCRIEKEVRDKLEVPGGNGKGREVLAVY
jgi:hypothetical protein